MKPIKPISKEQAERAQREQAARFILQKREQLATSFAAAYTDGRADVTPEAAVQYGIKAADLMMEEIYGVNPTEGGND